MNSRAFSARAARRILDFAIIVALILIAIVQAWPVLANHDANAVEREARRAESRALANPIPEIGSPAPELAPLDDIESAALMAAENAALTPPQYLTDLPLVTH